MSEKVTDETDELELEAPDKVAIEGKLPLTPIDIESQKDMKSGRHHKLRSLHKWFAARPTPAVRLAVLGSIYPGEIGSDELLKLMQIGPKAMKTGISEYVEKKFAQDSGRKRLDDHYNYENPNRQSPTQEEIDSLHETLREAWGGEIPTILDPTAGRGIIPFEASRYGLSNRVNELNPVPSVIIKAGLEYASEVGSLRSEFETWRSKINEIAKENISEYYPTESPDRTILNSACTYLIRCTSCEGKIPLTGKWWLNQRSGQGDAVRPIYNDGEVRYEHVKVPDEVSKDEFDPSEAPVKRRSAECPHCDIVVKQDEVERKIREGEYEYSVYGVNYETKNGEREFRAGSEVDEVGMEKAAKRVESDFELMTFMTEPVDISSRKSDPTIYGMEEWKDTYTPRQLVVHFEYYDAYQEVMPKIRDKYDNKKSEAILTLLTLTASRCVSFNSRFSQWYDGRGCTQNIFSENNYALKKMFGDNNLSAPRRGYIARSEQIIDSYEDLVLYNPSGDCDILSKDAATLSNYWDSESVEVAIVDPPYYDSIMYAELSDVFYVLQKEYLEDIHPELFESKLSDKDSEAVSNPYRFEEIANSEDSKDELADEHYESKMEQIFDEVHEVLKPGGVMTVMFTHRDMEAWDTLTSALINSGFTITATHPIKTEMSDRVVMQGSASVDSSIFLVGRKKLNPDTEAAGTLWEDIQSDIYQVAEQEAEKILDSGYSISKTDTAIAAYGPTLQRYAEEYPVVNKMGDTIKPRKALGEARKAVTSVIAERFLNTEGIDQLDSLTRWYVLSWLIYENDTFPYDEGRQLGVGAGVDIEDIKRPTKIWSKSGSDIQLKDSAGRVQDIVMLRNDGVDDPSSRKYPVDPTDNRFTYTIDTVHAAIHVYEREGAKAAWDWLTERNLKSDDTFEVAVTALLEVIPENNEMYETLINLISGETGEYLDINVDHIDMSGVDRQTSLGDHAE